MIFKDILSKKNINLSNCIIVLLIICILIIQLINILVLIILGDE